MLRISPLWARGAKVETGTKLIVAVFGGLIAYYVSTVFTTSLITGTTTADNLITNLVPITLAAAVVIIIIRVAFAKS